MTRPLTARQRAIALLISQDRLSRKEVAYRLGISRRTVDSHLTKVSHKLGTRGRDQMLGRMEEREA